jgi:hypothetical protein
MDEEKFDSEVLGEELEERELSKKKEQLVEHQWKTDFGQVFATKAGRRVLWRILSRCRIFGPVFSLKTLEMCRREGERNLGLWLLDSCSQTLLLEMITENYKQEEE